MDPKKNSPRYKIEQGTDEYNTRRLRAAEILSRGGTTEDKSESQGKTLSDEEVKELGGIWSDLFYAAALKKIYKYHLNQQETERLKSSHLNQQFA